MASATLLAVLSLTTCTNALVAEIEAIRYEAFAQTKIPVAPLSPTVAPVNGPAGSGKVLVSWAVVPGTTSYDVYYSSTVSPPAMPNGGTDLSGSSCTISELTNWNTYYFWVIAKNKLGSSPLSIPPATGQSGIRVTSVTLNKAAATFLVGSQETLSATCLPANATFPDVTWTTSNASCATVTGGTVMGGTTGSAIITATSMDGSLKTATLTANISSYAFNTAGPAGGILFYDKGSYSSGWRFMEAASNNTGANHTWRYGVAQVILGAQQWDTGTGKSNTDAIIVAQGSGPYFAYDCRSCTQAGYTDWFMPSMNEATIWLTVPGSKNNINSFFSSTQINETSVYGYDTLTSIWKAMNPNYPSGGSYYITRPIRHF